MVKNKLKKGLKLEIARIIYINKKVAKDYKEFCKRNGFVMQKRIELLMKEDMRLPILDNGKNRKLTNYKEFGGKK